MQSPIALAVVSDAFQPAYKAISLKYGAILLSSLLLHALTDKYIRYVSLKLFPKIHFRLRRDGKEVVFFGFFMGLVLTVLSSPSCSLAALEAWRDTHEPWHLTTNGKICAVARATLWIAELRTLNSFPMIMLHHAGALLALFAWLLRQWSNLVFLTIYATLVSEVGGDMVFLLSAYITAVKDDPGSSSAVHSIRNTMVHIDAWQYGLLRGGGIIVVVWKIYNDPHVRPSSLTDKILAYGLLCGYAVWCLRYVHRHISKISRRRNGRLATSSECKHA